MRLASLHPIIHFLRQGHTSSFFPKSSINWRETFKYMRLASIKPSKLGYNGTLLGYILSFLVNRQADLRGLHKKKKRNLVLCSCPGSDMAKSNGAEYRALKKLGFCFTGTMSFPWVEYAIICVMITLCPVCNAFEISCVSLGQHWFISLLVYCMITSADLVLVFPWKWYIRCCTS